MHLFFFSVKIDPMLCMSEKALAKCIRIMNLLSQRAISSLFAKPVDPNSEICPNYYQVIQHPMDLETVRNKLNNNSYKTVAEWKADVELIWSNSLEYNKNDPIIITATREMMDYFKKQSEYFSDNERLDWNQKLIALREQFSNAVEPYRNMGLYYKRSERIVNKPKSLSPKPSPKLNKSTKPKKKSINKRPLSKNAIIKLAKLINDTKEDSIRLAVVDILEDEESMVIGEEVNIDLSTLKPTTLIALRNKISPLVPQTP